ncbi:MAG: hypothetical protein ACYDEY_16165, partial [Acidimicrobiales bacterium]
SVPPLAVGPCVLTADEKSPVTGDCHAGSLWEPGGEIPPGHPTHHLEGESMHPALAIVALVAATTGRHFHIGPWIIVPILILVAIIGTIVFVVRDRQKRRARQTRR